MRPKPPLPRGFSLVEVLMASVLVLMVAGTSLALITQSMQAMERAQNRAIANNLHRAITSYLRILPWSSLSASSPTTLAGQLNQEFRSELLSFGGTSSIQVDRVTMAANNRMVQVELAIRFGAEVSSSSVRVARRGITP